MPEVLRFGISSLDQLLGVPSEKAGFDVLPGIYLPEPADGKARTESDGSAEPDGSFTTSVCIIGPTGTGKSIFALHMASTYLSDCTTEKLDHPTIELPTVLYISTDLTYKMAHRAWNNFALKYPLSRREPFVSKVINQSNVETPIFLSPCHPAGLAERFEIIENERGNVVFLDMAAYTAGDDWGFLHKLLSLLPTPNDDPARPSPRHLVVIDAIEGFEALAGELNAFGESSTRRSRIAQVMRLISGKCHAVLVVEQARETQNHETLGEEFVADTVIRLDSISTRNYERRVLKVEKCRGQAHIRGQHHYSIRSGKGSTTGVQENPDDPRIEAPGSQPNTLDKPTQTTDEDATQSYVQVFHSVHRISRKIMENKASQTESRLTSPTAHFAAFGIKYLDNMLGGKTAVTSHERDTGGLRYDTRGLPCRSTTALIGDSLTQKSTLGKAFLSRCFYSFNERLHELRLSLQGARRNQEIVDDAWRRITRKILLLERPPEITTKFEANCKQLLSGLRSLELIDYIEDKLGPHAIVPKVDREVGKFSEETLLTHIAGWLLDYEGGVAVMLVTHNTDFELLATDFTRWLHPESELLELRMKLPGYEQALKNYIMRGTICRRLEIHSLSSEVLIHVVQQAVHAGQRKLITSSEMENRHVRYSHSWPVRLVIDDFSSLRNIFPELREDPLLFPSILFHLEREGVTTLIVDTQSGKPETAIAERFETELRQMVHHHLYTWRVPFYGESRVAIAAIPPLSHEYAGIVRELRWESQALDGTHGEPATVDPHFELYSGLEEGKPEPVPLHVRFYAETPAMEEYIAIENEFLGEMFSAHAHPTRVGPPAIISGMFPPGYGDLRALAYLQKDTRLDYTCLFQVDEFWSMRPPGRHKRAGAFHPQWSYLDAITATSSKPQPNSPKDYMRNPYADPYELFVLRRESLPRLNTGAVSPNIRRRHFFEKYYEDFNGYEIFDTDDKEQFHIDRVPFSWDFGFLLCQEKAWKNNGRTFTIERPDGPTQELTVQEVWRSLAKAEWDEPPATGKSSRRKHKTAQEPAIEYVSWRVFAEACKKAAEEQSALFSKPVTAFDFAQISPESFSSLILEMWLSEIYDCLTRRLEKTADKDTKAALQDEIDNLLENLTKRQLFIPAGESKPKVNVAGGPKAPKRKLDDASGTEGETRKKRPIALLSLLDTYWLELYKAWLLLIEIMNLSDIIGDATVSTFDLKSKNTDFCAVASRHWYKTATQCPDEIAAKEPLVPVRLPGRFSVRGDWFLAVSGGSRSIRQAERALDLLSSRRANVTRLQMGVGLPTRVPKSAGPNQRSGHEALYTKLVSHQRGQDSLEYEAFLKIAANKDQKFYWLWRSSLEDYAPCNRIWHRWLNRTLLWWHRKLLRYRSAWRNSFHLHDTLTKLSPLPVAQFAPDAESLRVVQEKIRRAQSPNGRQRIEAKFVKGYPEASSLAQLKIRLEFLELLTSLKEELQEVPVTPRHER
jgi:KaiC/GvpD/RAD55 family RecA-like ATPase